MSLSFSIRTTTYLFDLTQLLAVLKALAGVLFVFLLGSARRAGAYQLLDLLVIVVLLLIVDGVQLGLVKGVVAVRVAVGGSVP